MRPVFDPGAVHHLKYQGAVDADGHVLEDAALWDHYIEAKYRERALRLKRDADGLEYLEIAGRPSKRTRKGYPATLGRMGQKDLDAFKPHPDKTYAANMPYGACNAEERLKLLDAEGLDAAVLYPTRGILWEAELTDTELSQAYCRAYNRWIADFCRGSRGRLIPIAHLSLGDPAAAAIELERAVKDGCHGAFVVPFRPAAPTPPERPRQGPGGGAFDGDSGCPRSAGSVVEEDHIGHLTSEDIVCDVGLPRNRLRGGD